MVYVDDFKMAGPKENMEAGWKLIKKGLKIEDPKTIDKSGVLYLGCKQSVDYITLPDKTKITTMTYDMENFLESCVSSYLELVGLTADKLRSVPTPFIPEDHRESPAGAPQGGDNQTSCPWCKHTFSASCSSCADRAALAGELDKLASLGGAKLSPELLKIIQRVKDNVACPAARSTECQGGGF